MSQVARSPSLVDLLAEATNSAPELRLIMGGARVAEEDDAPPVVSEIKLSSSVMDVVAALPERLRDLFRATRADGYVRLERKASTLVSKGELGENLLDATKALIGARFEVWPSADGCSLEVSPADRPHFLRSQPFVYVPEEDDGEVL